ncbi:hypothetical protein ACOSQ2_007963 [Xanthoceras sorbifolium]
MDKKNLKLFLYIQGMLFQRMASSHSFFFFFFVFVCFFFSSLLFFFRLETEHFSKVKVNITKMENLSTSFSITAIMGLILLPFFFFFFLSKENFSPGLACLSCSVF